MTESLINQIKKSGKKYSCVVGIANGGLNISKTIADSLSLQHKIVHISHYDGEVLRENPQVGGSHPGDNCLVVDDLIDSGKTVNKYKEMFGCDSDFAVLFCNLNAHTANYYIKEKQDQWIVFPWEKT